MIQVIPQKRPAVLLLAPVQGLKVVSGIAIDRIYE
jgi:hypothetical protein